MINSNDDGKPRTRRQYQNQVVKEKEQTFWILMFASMFMYEKYIFEFHSQLNTFSFWIVERVCRHPRVSFILHIRPQEHWQV